MTRTAWHPAFVQAIEHELEDYLDVLTFESEHQLTTEPLKIDVLIIKKEKNVVIEKNIARIFRTCNVVEYKSPRDRATIESYHKTHCYARLYASLNKIDINEMSVTVVATRHPRKLFAFLKKQYTLQHVGQGIYLVQGDTCPTQVIVSEELSEDDNLWLNNLRDDLTTEQLDRVVAAAENKSGIDAYTYAIGAANIETMEDLQMRRKKGIILSEKLDAAFNEKFGIPARRNMLLTAIRTKFKRVPKNIEKAVLAVSDQTALESLLAQVIHSETLDEFAEVVH